jgi:hypothetical protein
VQCGRGSGHTTSQGHLAQHPQPAHVQIHEAPLHRR